jgi:HAE1 family hydrophobic/amphiphilic exporter-1
MTSLAFILGCVPLAIASGSGAVSRKVMGTAVIGGMLTATFIAIFIIPAMFYFVEKLVHRKDKGGHEPPKGPDVPGGGGAA